MTRLILVAIVLLVLLGGSPPGLAQVDYGEGTAADAATTSAATTFITDYIDLFNARNVAAVDLVSPNVWSLFFSSTYEDAVNYLLNVASSIELYTVDKVRVYPSGHVSVDTVYSGWITPYALYTQRFYLLPLAAGGYVIEDYAYSGTPRVPDRFTTTELDVSIGLGGVVVEPSAGQGSANLATADVLLYHIENSDQSTVLTTGVYILPAGVPPEQANAEILNGNTRFLEYVGPTPIWPDSEWTFAFLIEPGTTYLIQGFTLDANGQNPMPLAGSEFVSTITIAEVARDPLPEALYGTWTGTAVQTNPDGEYAVSLTLTGGSQFDVVGTSDYPTLGCGGSLVLWLVTDDTAVAAGEAITYDAQGTCISAGFVTLALNDDGTLSYEWRYAGPLADGVARATATLERVE